MTLACSYRHLYIKNIRCLYMHHRLSVPECILMKFSKTCTLSICHCCQVDWTLISHRILPNVPNILNAKVASFTNIFEMSWWNPFWVLASNVSLTPSKTDKGQTNHCLRLAFLALALLYMPRCPTDIVLHVFYIYVVTVTVLSKYGDWLTD